MANKVLTLEEIRTMDGQLLWCVEKRCYCFIEIINSEIYACRENSDLYFRIDGLTFYNYKKET